MGNPIRFFIALAFLLSSSFVFSQTCATENFTNLPTASPGTYAARSWTGTDGVTWTAQGARTDQTLNGKAICFGTAGTRSVTSPTYTGGLGTLSFNYVRGFTGTGARTLQVFINGTQVGTNITVSTSSNAVVNYSVAHNIAGNVIVEIRATGAQIIVDDITWTCYSAGLTADFSASAVSVCSGSSVTFTNASTGTTGSATYAWNFGANASPATATGAGPHSVTYTGSGTSDVSLTVTDGTTDTETKAAFITTVPLPTVNAGSAIATICQGQTTTALGGSFGGSATGAVWSDGGAGGSFSNNGGSTPNTATYTASATSPSSVTLTLTTSGGSCGSAGASKTINVDPLPLAPIANGGNSPQNTNVNISDFDANWSGVAGAISYNVYVTQPASTSITETFTSIGGGTTSSYNTRSWTGDGGITWSAYKARTDQTLYTSNDAITLQDAAGAYLESGVIVGSPSVVSFDVQQKFGGSGGVLTLKILSGSGFSTSTTIGTVNITTAIQAGVTFNITGITGPYKIRLENSTAVRPCIDNLTFQSDESTQVFGSPFSTSGTSLNINGLTADETYEYYVTAVSSCGEGPASNPVSVTLGCLAPGTPSSSAVLNTATTSTLDFNWIVGNGTSRLIIARLGSATTAVPLDGSTYSADTDITLAPVLGDGFVVYNGSGNSASISGLTSGTEYFFTVYEYNCSPGAEKYFTTSYTFSFSTKPENVTLSENCTTASSHELSWTFPSGNYDGVIIFARAGATSSGPGATDASTYFSNSNYSLSTDLGAKGRVVYKGAGNNVLITGLTVGVNYAFSAYTYVGETSTSWSSGTSLSQTIAVNDVSSFFAVAGNQEATISWTNPNALCFDEVLVVANQGAVSFTPSGDGSAYAANSVYSSSNQVVYQGLATSVIVTGLTNLQEYCFRIFVRSGTEWSFGLEQCVIPTTVTEFEPGDLAIVAVNTQVLSSGGTDEVCFVSFKTITEGTTFFMTDNGYERVSQGLWGDTEGVARFTRKIGSGVVPAGTTICVNGPYSSDPRYDIIVCGVLDNDNWIIDPDVTGAPSGATSFDLNSSDQVWITQGGTWTNPSGSQNMSYNGNVLYGWSGIDWKENLGSVSPTWTTAGSRLIPSSECFTTSLGTVTTNDKTKYTGPMTSTTKVGWIQRINNAANWTGYTDNNAYDNEVLAYDYFAECIVFAIDASTEIAGKWLGSSDDNWFNCSNWDTRIVPDSTIDVTILNTPGLNSDCKVDVNADFAYLYNNEAVCNDISIADKSLILEGSPLNVVRVKGDLSILTDGTLDMNDGTPATDGSILLSGNWNNVSNINFDEGNGYVHFIGSAQQEINTTDDEVFANLLMNNSSTLLQTNISISGVFDMIGGRIDGNGFETTLGLNSSTLGTLNHSSGRINGSFSRWINGSPAALLFPLGSAVNNQFLFATINSVSSGKLTTQFIASSPGLLGLPLNDDNYSVESLFSEGYWSANATDGLNPSSYNLTLATTAFTSQTFSTDVRVVYRPTLAEAWTTSGIHSPALSPNALRNNITGYGEFALGVGRKCLTDLQGPTSSQVVCNPSEFIALTVNPNDGEAPFNYQWYYSVVDNTSSGISVGSANGGQSATYTIPLDFEGAGYFYCVVSQPGSACGSITSSTSYAEVKNTLPVALHITPTTVDLCSSNTEQTFGLTVTNVGSAPFYQWYLNSNPVGSNLATYTAIALNNGDQVYVSVTSNEFCTLNEVFTSEVVTISVTSDQLFYQDLDGDGFGNASISVLSCTAPIGYVSAPAGDLNGDGLPDYDCNDTDEDVNPAAEEYCSNFDENCNGQIDEGLTTTIFYADVDGDGFGNPLNTLATCSGFIVGYVLNNTDCNDASPSAGPGVQEICDGIDNDCDGQVDEVCGPPNDHKFTAIIIYPNTYGSCSNFLGSLFGATTSPESQSSVVTGEDVWYYFVAPTSGVSIQCTSNSNILLELQHQSGALVEVENVVSASGMERLNYSGLIPGQTYYIIVRNYNSGVTPNANFNICVQKLEPSKGDNVNNPISLCSYLKADFTNANQYIYHFPFGTINGPYAAVANGSTNTYLMLSGISQIAYGSAYSNILVDALYSIPNGAGTMETIIIPGVQTCTMNTTQQPSLALKAIDQCPNSKSLGTTLRAEPNLCGDIIDFEWEFTETYPGFGLPIYVNRNAANRYFRVSWIPGVLPGMEFDVRIRPIYAGNIPGNWSTTSSCLKIIGLANLAVASEEDEMLLSTEQTFGSDISESVTIYPNPSNGDYLGIVSDRDSDISKVNIHDLTGRICFSRENINQKNMVISMEQSLPNGAYLIEIIYNDGVSRINKWVVSN